MENYDQRVTIFFALCPLSYDIILGVVRKGIDGLRRRLGGETSGEERELLKTSSCHTARAFGQEGENYKPYNVHKGMSKKKQNMVSGEIVVKNFDRSRLRPCRLAL